MLAGETAESEGSAVQLVVRLRRLTATIQVTTNGVKEGQAKEHGQLGTAIIERGAG